MLYTLAPFVMLTMKMISLRKSHLRLDGALTLLITNKFHHDNNNHQKASGHQP
jgi:hypothetical protein